MKVTHFRKESSQNLQSQLFNLASGLTKRDNAERCSEVDASKLVRLRKRVTLALPVRANWHAAASKALRVGTGHRGLCPRARSTCYSGTELQSVMPHLAPCHRSALQAPACLAIVCDDANC